LIKLAAAWSQATVWFVSNDYLSWLALREVLPPSWRDGPVAERVAQAAKALRDDYRNLDRSLGLSEGDEVWWEASTLGERNANSSDVLLTAARLRMIDDILTKDGCHLLVADEAFGRFLYQRMIAAGLAVGWERPGATPGLAERVRGWCWALRWRMRALRKNTFAALRFLQRILILRKLRWRHPLPLEALQRADVMMIAWTRPETFAGGHLQQDAFLGELPGQLARAGHVLAFLAKPIWWVVPFRAIAEATLASGAPAVFVEDLVGIGDVLRALTEALLLSGRCRRLLRGKAGLLADAVRFEIPRQAERGAAVYAATLRNVGRGMKRLGLAPRFVVYLYENHPWEKTLTRGVRCYLADSQTVAVMHAPFPGLDVSYLPTDQDIAANHIPDLFMALGVKWRDEFLNLGFPAERLEMIGALRYGRMANVPMPDWDGNWRLLCCTGINLAESIELCVKAVKASSGRSGVSLTINFHPLADEHFRKILKEAVSCYGHCDLSHLVYSPLSVKDLLGQSHIILYENTAAAFDAGWSGRTLVHVGAEARLDLDTMVEGGAFQVRTVDELLRVLDSVLIEPATDQTEALRRIITRSFGAIDVAVLLRRLEPCAES